MTSIPVPRLLQGRRVLVVDDDADGRELLCELLEEAGAEVRGVGDADRAMTELRDFAPHLLVCDLSMPGEDGYALMRRIRALPAERGGRVRSAAFTGFGRQEDRDRSAEAGFDLHLVKPVEAESIAEALADLLD